jgi:hypothetical protein
MEAGSKPTQRHVWPWFVAFALIFGVLLAIVWMRAEIQRAKEQQNYRYDVPITNGSVPPK